MSDKIRVLVVDDSSLVRKIVTDILEKDPMIKVVGTANNGKTAIFKNDELNPDVITLDIEMPILDGLSTLEQIIETNPKPVIMMSVLTQHGAEATFKALYLGAVDFIPKPSSVLSLSVDEFSSLLLMKVKSVYKSKVNISKDTREESISEKIDDDSDLPETPREFTKDSESDKIVGMGTSTGGPAALVSVFQSIPENFPSSLLVVQHLPEGFTKAFSERLDGVSNLNVKEAENNDIVKPGWGYIAPGHSHMAIEKNHDLYIIKLKKGAKVSGHRPSIDVLFNSIAEYAGKKSIGVIMTGMGRDGAGGIGKIKKSGGLTIAQDEKTSVVYGMNRVSIENGVIDNVVQLFKIPEKIVENI